MFGMLAVFESVTAFASLALEPTVTVTPTDRMFSRSVAATADVGVPRTFPAASGS